MEFYLRDRIFGTNHSNTLLYTFSLTYLHVQGVEEEC
jgi:hypothetical protein